VNEIAEKLNVKPVEVRIAEVQLTGKDISIESTTAQDEDHLDPIDYLTDEENEPSKILEHKEIAQLHVKGLTDALKSLDPRSRQIIKARWINERPATLQDMGAKYGVSAERIRQLEGRALKKLRTLITYN
jgi:RNA polymerase sigma-32 factor